MQTRATGGLPARLKRLRRRFDRWRQTRQGRPRIPAALWAAAVKTAGKYGLCRTAQALGLDYYSLKKRIEAAGREPGGRTTVFPRTSAGQPAVEFIELAPPTSASAPECVLELEDRHGAKMRVHLKGGQSPDLAALSRSFWSVEICHDESRPPRRTGRGRR